MKIPGGAHHELALPIGNVSAGRRAVRLRDRLDEILQRQAVGAEEPRIGEHVILLLEATEAHHVGHARYAFQVTGYDPILPTADLARRVSIALERILIYLPYRRVIRP